MNLLREKKKNCNIYNDILFMILYYLNENKILHVLNYISLITHINKNKKNNIGHQSQGNKGTFYACLAEFGRKLNWLGCKQ